MNCSHRLWRKCPKFQKFEWEQVPSIPKAAYGHSLLVRSADRLLPTGWKWQAGTPNWLGVAIAPSSDWSEVALRHS